MSPIAKSLAFQSSRDSVKYLLNRSDLAQWEKVHIARIVADLNQLLIPLIAETAAEYIRGLETKGLTIAEASDSISNHAEPVASAVSLSAATPDSTAGAL